MTDLAAKKLVRFKFVEAMIEAHGDINRHHIQRCFGIASAAASRVMTEYKAASGNIFTQGTKIYPCGEFNKVFLDIDANEFISAAEIMAPEKIIRHEVTKKLI